MRTRKRGLWQGLVIGPSDPEKPALPRALRDTGGVSKTVSMLFPLSVSPALHTNVPITCVIGPGVPLNTVPLITSPWTWKNAAPLLRSTAAWPPLVVQANVPLSMSATGLSTFCAVMTPTMERQLATECESSASAAEANISDSSAVKRYFISNLLLVLRFWSVLTRPVARSFLRRRVRGVLQPLSGDPRLDSGRYDSPTIEGDDGGERPRPPVRRCAAQ